MDKKRSSIHLGGDYNLDTVDGVRDAIAELDGLRRALNRRGKAIEDREEVEELGEEDSWNGFEDDEDEDDE